MPDKSVFNSADGYSVPKDNSFRQVREQASYFGGQGFSEMTKQPNQNNDGNRHAQQ
ncbi:MAG: hypothetical protein WCA38_04890 [Candidatus Acidiferrales bacterium]